MESKESYNPIFDRYPVGREFTYMGVLMRVTKVDRCSLPIPIGSAEDIIAYCIHCDYITKDGYFNSKSFSLGQMLKFDAGEEFIPEANAYHCQGSSPELTWKIETVAKESFPNLTDISPEESKEIRGRLKDWEEMSAVRQEEYTEYLHLLLFGAD